MGKLNIFMNDPQISSSYNSAPPRARDGVSALAGILIMFALLILVAAGSFVSGASFGLGAQTPSATGSPLPAESAESPEVVITTCTAPSEEFEALCEVYARIQNEYVDQVNEQSLVEGAIRGMLEYGLEDPYSGYVPPGELNQLDQLSGNISGIGAEVGITNLADPENLEDCTQIGGDCVLTVIAPIPGSPAEAAGLRPGDIITAIDGVSTAGSTVDREVLRVRGEAGTNVTLSIERDNTNREVVIQRQIIDIPMVRSQLLSQNVGYVHLALFGDQSALQLRGALVDLFARGADRLILDLRNNPGGYINAAQDVASEFINEGLLFTQESGEVTIRWTAKPGGVATDPAIPMVVLINGGSASASEIVAAALKEYERATLVGEPTFGKNTVQVWTPLQNGGGLRLTTDRWFTPGHDTVEGEGIEPDVLVTVSSDAEALEDPALQRAVEILQAAD